MSVSNQNLLKQIEMAKKHLHEDETRKVESLYLFREWIDKHAFIKRCRNDDIFLLQFLRTKKYRLEDAFNSFEKHFLLREKRPEWFDSSSSNIERFKDLARVGYHYILSDLDENGESVYIVNGERFNTEKYGSKEAFSTAYLTAGIVFENEIIQILGGHYVLDYTTADKKLFEMATPKNMIDWVTSYQAMPGRYKKIFIIGLSPIYNTLLNICKMAVSEKLRNRIHLLKEPKELAKYFNPKILPKKYGGIKEESEIIEKFLQRIEKYSHKLKESNDYEIDCKRLIEAKEKKVNEFIGSFRKLEID